MLPDTVSPLELAWMLAATVGIILAAINYLDAREDAKIVRAAPHTRALLITANGETTDQGVILFCLVCKFMMGVFASLALPSRETDGDMSLASIWVPVLMIAVAVALVALSFLKRIRRKQVALELRNASS